jgi:hypothetical protein
LAITGNFKATEGPASMAVASSKNALGAEHLAAACTTHFSVVDRSTFGSKYVPAKRSYRDAANRRWSSDKKKCPRHLQVMLYLSIL